MTTVMNVTQTRLERLLDERVAINRRHEDTLAAIEARENKVATEVDSDMLAGYRQRQAEIDQEVTELYNVLEREREAAEASARIRPHLAEAAGLVTGLGGEIQGYKTFAAFARDKLINQFPDIAARVTEQERMYAKERLQRDVAHTLSSDIDGLIVPTHIQQIMDVIDAVRPVVTSGNRVDLSSGKLTWPKINARPTVEKQSAEKQETNSQTVDISMEDDNADTYLGAANLSWQAINWSTPAALDLVFRLLAEQYAKKTEAAACTTLSHAATTIGTPLTGDGTDSFDDWLQAIVAGVQAIEDATDAVADTLWLSSDMFFYAAVLTSDSNAMFLNQGNLNLQTRSGSALGLNVVRSKQFDTGTAIVGDSRALMIGETAGAPVQLRATEPSIAGLEIGVVGAFKSISFDDERFADIGPTT